MKMKIACLAATLVAISFIGCKTKKTAVSGVNEMQRFEEGSRTPINDVTLPHLKAHFAKAGIPAPNFRAELVQLNLPGGEKDPQSQTSVNVAFENLTVEQCKTLRSAYFQTDIACGENGVFPWDNRRYVWTIKDFLSPVMQATLKLTMSPENKTTGAEQFTNEFGSQTRTLVSALEANCWSTAYEVARQQSNQYTVHVVDSTDADKIFKNPSYTKFVFSGDRAGLENAIQKGGLGNFGELLIIRNNVARSKGENSTAKGSIAHAAVFVDGNLLFERVGNAGHLPMRLVRLDDSLKSYPDSAYVYEIRQVLQPFPHVSQIPGVTLVKDASGEGTYSRTNIVVKDFNLEKVSWEYRLPEEAFSPILR